jgi:GTP-binding protein
METTTILYIILSLIIGGSITFVLKKNKRISELTSENASLLSKLSESENKVKKISQDSEKTIDDVKERYKTLLNETQEQCKKLDKQLKNALEGIVDESIKEQLAEVEQLKKKIIDLEEEIEEKEDDVSTLKKKIRNKDSDLSDLQNSLDKERRSSKELNEELSSVKDQLNEKVEELKLKMGSLAFLQEILSAKEISTKDITKLNKNIDFFESFVKGQFTTLNDNLYSTYNNNLSWNNINGKAGFENKKAYFHNAFDQWASTKRKSWLDGKTTIAFVGEFSAGKTSIVNRILSQDNPNIPQLPVSTKATTAIPTYIAGGSTVSYSFISGDGKRKTILEDTFKKVSKDILDQVKGVSSLIKYFVMTYENPNLKGLSILDTPGFNSNDSEDRDRTIEVINECDALFWVFDVNAGTVNRSSISIIKEKLNKPLYVVINKVDTKADSEVQKVENLIKKTLSDAGLQVQQFIKFSSKAPLTSIMNPIKEVNKITTRDTFVSDVKTDLEQLLNTLNELVESSNQSYYNAIREGDNITEQIHDDIKALQGDCEIAYNIPKWVEHFFSSNRFEMSAEDGNRLKKLLEQIAEDRINDLKKKFDEQMNKTAEIQQKWSNTCDLKAAWQKVNNCFEQYKKVTKYIE